MMKTLAELVLPAEGYVIEKAWDGAEGLEKALANPPALIITDMAMPRMTGLEMVERLTAAGKRIPVIMITAEGSEATAVRALRDGLMDYFIKPFEIDDLLAAIERVLSASRVGDMPVGVPDQAALKAANLLFDTGKSVVSSLELEDVLLRVVEGAVEMTGAEEGSLMLLDPENGELYTRASYRVEEGFRHLRLKVRDSLAGQVVNTGEPLFFGGEGIHKVKTHYLVQSLIYVPIKLRDQVIGVLGVHNRETSASLSALDIAMMSTLADYAAIAIANSQSFTQSERERAKLNRIFQQSQDPILLLDLEGVVSAANPAAAAVFRSAAASSDTLIGRKFTDLTASRSMLDLIAQARIRGTASGETQLNDERTMNVNIGRVSGLGYVLTMQDISHLKALDKVKSEYVTTVSHDLRSPLTAILSYVELMGRVGELNERQRDFAANVRSSVEAITTLINDLLELSRIEAGLDRQREPLYVSQIVQGVVKGLKPKAGVRKQTITLNLPDDEPQILGSMVRLRQVFSNLVDNAIKYTPEGGLIDVTVFSEGGQLVAAVSDTGIGIPPEAQPHIFDKFYRVPDVEGKYEGSGLGLNIVKTIVEAHDGRIWVDSTSHGTTFTCIFQVLKPDEGRPTSGAG
ncbi:MAG: response regulator [Anaerolineae bacterium]|nr:response regulator [Anaerolineae bacterium]